MTFFREPTREWLDRLEVAVDALTAGYSGYDPADTGGHLLEDYVPGGGTLTSANFCATLQAAVDALVTTGGVIIVPPGTWAPSTPNFATITVLGQGYSAGSLVIRGSGAWVTRFYMPQGWTGKQFDLDGYSSPGPASGPLTEFWLSDMTIGYPTSHVSNTGVGIHLRAVVSGGLRNLGLVNGYGGTGIQCTDPGGGNNSQYVTLDHIAVNGWDVSYDLTAFSVGSGVQVHSSSAITADFLLDDCKGTFDDTAIQSSPSDAAIVLAGVGGCDITFSGLYTEGTYTTYIRAEQPSVSANTLRVTGTSNATHTVFIVAEVYNTLHVDVAGMDNATTILAATGGPYVTFNGSAATPEAQPGKYSLDATSKARLSAYTSVTSRSGGGVQLVGYATGAEPAVYAGALLQSTTYLCPRYYTGAAWKNVVLEGAADDLHALLWPYATDIWDAQSEALHLTPTIDLQGWRGQTLTYNVGNALTRDTACDVRYPTGRLRPTTALTYAAGTMASPSGSGGTVGVLVVAAMPASGGGAGSNPVISLANAANTREVRVGCDDGNVATKWYSYVLGPSAGSILSPAATRVLGAPTLVYAVTGGGTHTLGVNGVETSSSTTGTMDTDLDRVSLFATNPTGYTGCSTMPALLFAAYLHSVLPAEVKTRMYAIVRRDFGVKLDPA
jgi:hypothetical protein